MPPELPHYCSFSTPLVRFSPPSSPETDPISPVICKSFKGNKTMKIPGRKLIPLLVFILSTISILRLLRIATTTNPSHSPLPTLPPNMQPACSFSSPKCSNVSSNVPNSSLAQQNTSTTATVLTKKEFELLSNLVKRKSPCNLLFFGLEAQYLKLSSINSGGITVFLEDDPDKINSVRAKTNSTHIYKVDYHEPAKKAYQLLKHARKTRACVPRSARLQNSTCKLALRHLPEEVYKQRWDIVVVDGPSGHSPEAPGRMAAIYTASVIARAGNTTEVLVHDVDRTIEKWFSWEFLCEENLVSSKGNLWNFKITGNPNSTKFCMHKTAFFV
ncbi:glucuronoxylan 4-O-methyltransferase 1 [Mercurialis annua]|uniref:glucuronoxylan 4-O-methyltransferase 1 n=1 Tax=Mercurialis annua TaxID=3986 RepID=UPI002160D078|nr:glucuronoxylan 4-O-methyltransferase 1 [Mercurialis annua]